MEEQVLELVYKNWKGKINDRKVIPIEMVYGTSEYHEGEQWFLVAKDLDKDAERWFAMKDIVSFV